ncbi:MAG: hypothetical protein P1U70_23000 [Saprospiraceae bacterium]|nr:hypothetical protein [Saprospiraceae bacterium]
MTNEERGLKSCPGCNIGFPDDRAVHMHTVQCNDCPDAEIDEETMLRYIRELNEEKEADKKALMATFGGRRKNKRR